MRALPEGPRIILRRCSQPRLTGCLVNRRRMTDGPD